MQTNQTVLDVRQYFIDLQSKICRSLEEADGSCKFSTENTQSPNGGLAQPRVTADGKHIEKAAVQFSHSLGDSLPPAATERNPHLAGAPFQATAISMIVHPQNPFAPTTHMNLRFFIVDVDEPVWYFGGGYDLTPYYGFKDDCIHWHQVAKQAVGRHYENLKAQCDDYFFLSHRQECRGIGGIFFDDWTEGGFEESYRFVQNVGDSFLDAYMPLFETHKDDPYTDKERDFQLVRRGRYAEFNLAIDRGTKYGIQSGRRIESVLASLPPLVKWLYDYRPPEGSREAELTDYYLQPKDWLALVDNSGD